MKYSESGLVRIAKRENNTKRNYLVVNPLQGKHIPVSPSKALELFAALADTLRGEYTGEKLLFVGFAETATAIGAQVAISLGAPYIQTTREPIPDVEYLFFSEEHSHATEQKLVKNDIDSVAADTDRIIFVEDEVTTGKTILNIITILDRLYEGRFKYSVASLLNGMSSENLGLYAEKGINLHYLVKTDHSGYADRAETFAGDGEYNVFDKKLSSEAGREDLNGLYREIAVSGRMDSRRLVDSKKYEQACATLAEEMMNFLGNVSEKKILVVGTEECMYPALYAGRKLEEIGHRVFCHSTTRSPIAVSSEEDYPLHSRYELRSLYDSDRKTFLYDIGKYDIVYIVTDASEKSGILGTATLINALAGLNDNIILIRWC